MPEWDSSRLLNAAIDAFDDFPPSFWRGPQPELPAEGFDVDHLLHLIHRWIRRFPKSEVTNTASYSKRSRTTYSALSLIIDKTGDWLSKVLPRRTNSSSSEETRDGCH
ncbi:uncharacterized protein LOC120109533 [Phoenix dactylifera]|uniref:Uncharacterized protein LOC113463290 n=1 Tax=Phoenix dactylifera TaxID=42345 RepID=A0A8B9A7N5_PHODC|nr:uncharacterized protein LOC113463290 [Phoenix dactylifera]XP_038979194.1 uncharacterized protein LOC120109533 [Phoenix dactylifera]